MRQEQQDERIPTTRGLTELQYREIVDDIRRQPAWRGEADRCAGFYDGNQMTAEEAAELEARGMSPIIVNHIKPLVNSVLGLEAKTRSDWRVAADRDDEQDLAEALSAKLMEAERESRADQACSEAFASMLKGGVGWVGITRNADPFGYRYKVEAISRREIWWDWHARRADLSDARYLVRERWYPVDSVAAVFPDKAELIYAACSGWAPEWQDLARESEPLLHAFGTEKSGWFEDTWRNVDRRLVCLREVWYRVHTRGKVIALPDGRTVPFDKANPAHALAEREGLSPVWEAVYSTLRVSIWAGPHRLQDEDCGRMPLPYVPFWGYREDASNAPYGIIRDLVPLQLEINARRRKLQWLLASKRVLADSDALDRNYNDFSDLAAEVARPDAVVVLDPNRRNPNGISIENDLSLSAQQFQVMAEAGDAMQRVAGIFNSMLGAADGASSGRAISSLVDQGNTMQAEITDNYRFARTLVGQRLLELVTQDLTGVEMPVTVGEAGRQRRVTLNQPMLDVVTGLTYRENDVSKTLAKVALNDVPSTPAYRAQAMTMIAEVIKGLPPQLQAPLVPFFLESTDLPKRREMADIVRKVLGLGEKEGEGNPPPPDPEKQQMQQAMGQMQQALQAGAAQVDELMAKLADKAEEMRLKAGELALKEREQAAKEEKTRAEVAKLQAETLRARVEMADRAVAMTAAQGEGLAVDAGGGF